MISYHKISYDMIIRYAVISCNTMQLLIISYGMISYDMTCIIYDIISYDMIAAADAAAETNATKEMVFP